MDYTNITVPYLKKTLIKNKADQFREKYWDDSVPVNIEDIISVKLEMDIILTPGLHRFCDTDALITSDWKSIYVDEERFNDDRSMNRLRFSYAHEIAHYVLHRSIYKEFGIGDFEDMYEFLQDIPGRTYQALETQADIFANFLLVPRDRLIAEKGKCLEMIEELDASYDEKTLNAYIARPIANVFGVSPTAIEIALNNEC